MNKSFVRELVITNYLIIVFFAAITIIANLYYGGSAAVWSRALGLVAVLALALTFKIKRIKAKGDNLDERLQLPYFFLLNRSSTPRIIRATGKTVSTPIPV